MPGEHKFGQEKILKCVVLQWHTQRVEMRTFVKASAFVLLVVHLATYLTSGVFLHQPFACHSPESPRYAFVKSLQANRRTTTKAVDWRGKEQVVYLCSQHV